MATTTILQPQDCLRRDPSSPAFVPSRHPSRDRNTLRVRRRKQSSIDNAGISNNNSNSNHVDGRRLVVPRFPPSSNNLVMGQVRILKRGEELSKKPMMKIRATGAAADRGFVTTDGGDKDFVLSSTDRLGPDPETVQKHVRVSDGLYAGPASLLASPPPSSLPFPAFFAKERKNDAATSDLRRLLGLDLA